MNTVAEKLLDLHLSGAAIIERGYRTIPPDWFVAAGELVWARAARKTAAATAWMASASASLSTMSAEALRVGIRFCVGVVVESGLSMSSDLMGRGRFIAARLFLIGG